MAPIVQATKHHSTISRTFEAIRAHPDGDSDKIPLWDKTLIDTTTVIETHAGDLVVHRGKISHNI